MYRLYQGLHSKYMGKKTYTQYHVVSTMSVSIHSTDRCDVTAESENDLKTQQVGGVIQVVQILR